MFKDNFLKNRGGARDKAPDSWLSEMYNHRNRVERFSIGILTRGKLKKPKATGRRYGAADDA